MGRVEFAEIISYTPCHDVEVRVWFDGRSKVTRHCRQRDCNRVFDVTRDPINPNLLVWNERQRRAA